MGTGNSKQMVTKFVATAMLLLSAHAAQALSLGTAARNVRDAQAQTEAGVACADGLCTMRGANPGIGQQNANQISGFQGLLHQIAVLSDTGVDPRRVVERKGEYSFQAQLENVVPVFNERTGKFEETEVVTSAFQVSPCLLVTSYHSVYGTDPRNPKRNPQPKISVGSGSNNGFKYHQLEVEVVKSGSLKVNNEYALLRIKGGRCVGSDPDIGWADFAADSGERCESGVKIAGYFKDIGVNRTASQNSCRIIRTESDGTVIHNCSSTPGTSGAPIYCVKNGVPQVMAIHAGSFTSQNGILKPVPAHLNYGVDGSMVFDNIIDEIAKDLDGKVNPLAMRTRNLPRNQTASNAIPRS